MYSSAMMEGPRAARLDELPAVVELSNSVFSPDGAIDMGRVFPTLFSAVNIGNLRIMVDEGMPVSLSGMKVQELHLDAVVVRAACVGSVCTREAYRGRGLAARLMDDCVSTACAQGASLLMVSGGRGLYRRMGCVDAGLFSVIQVRRDGKVPEVSCRVREWTEADVPDLEALHRQERVRFVRASGEMLSLLQTGALHAQPGHTWVVRIAEGVAGYLCVSGPDARTGPCVLVAREIAGSRAAVLAAAHPILDASGAERLDIEIPASDEELISLARPFGCAIHAAGMHGTMKIIDPSAFRSSDAELVFGSIERQLPASTPQVRPLPLPRYGLNYI
jgi:GNAT superfamily N-acetyltransferase